MAFSVKDDATDEVVRKLAKLKGKSITETIREAAENELKRTRKKIPLAERLEANAKAYAAKHPLTGLKADKAFFDWLAGEED